MTVTDEDRALVPLSECPIGLFYCGEAWGVMRKLFKEQESGGGNG